ncbi:MAG: hypothetical protein B6I38_01745 [Anaerolineaceae bacterium 4572_5.1]|nr:MAG: hypothetical protein B6I38_01745 [Anaerolineaceae bacterium 4572_5.1]RLD03618.1 MAG: hypothetical protein DRI56_12145 [Chloroflexota bacterium]
MRLTPEVLYDITKKFIAKKVEKERTIIAVYLRGSLLYGSPLLGGVGDIDIVCIHSFPPETKREIKRLTAEIHYDIEHHDQLLYKEPRLLRVDPWWGPTLYDAKILYDSQHLIDYVQAGVRGQFNGPEQVMGRIQSLLKDARQFWLTHQFNADEMGLEEVEDYLTAVEQAVNAVALLTGPALAARRLGVEFANRAQSLGQPQLYGGFLELLGSATQNPEGLRKWLPLWEESFDALAEDTRPVNLHPHRKGYYRQGFESLLKSEHPKSMLWPLLKTWSQIASALPAGHPANSSWEKVCAELGLTGEGFSRKLEALDAYLEEIENLINSWGTEHGAI